MTGETTTSGTEYPNAVTSPTLNRAPVTPPEVNCSTEKLAVNPPTVTFVSVGSLTRAAEPPGISHKSVMMASGTNMRTKPEFGTKTFGVTVWQSVLVPPT